MKQNEKKILEYFETNARSPDLAPYIILKEQLAVLKAIQKDIAIVKKYIANKGITDTSS